MREIKFRAWDRYAKKMCDVYTIDFPTGHLFTDIGDSNLGAEVEALMQSTGLHDKNGVEIFEGDIVRIRCDGDGMYRDDIAMVSFGYTCFVLRSADEKDETIEHIKKFYIDHGYYEVIGNIYENPELLEDENV